MSLGKTLDLTNLAAYECLVVVGGAVWQTLAAMPLSVCLRAAVATDLAYHHQSECAMNE